MTIPKPETFITSIRSLEELLENSFSLRNCTLQALDFRSKKLNWQQVEIDNTCFLGCQMPLEEELVLRQKGAHIFTAPDNLPYNPFRSSLYTWQELMQGYTPEQDNSLDWQIYQHFSAARYHHNINEALWQRIHDHAIDDGLRQLLHFDHNGMTQKKVVGFMGGHSARRDDPFYIKSAHTAKRLGENGYFVASGGGPGIMEAANLGAYFAHQPLYHLEEALQLLQQAPYYKDKGYHACALEVLSRFPQGQQSLAIPTWFYGHEPSNLFASHIAKYFSNSIREDTLLAVSLYGIVFAPGSAGTTQEIFMDATQNHYGTFNYYSPMVFLGRKRYEIDTLIYPLLRQLAWGKPFYDLLYLTDEPQEVVDFLQQHPPVKV
ncbi:MAG TPA: hypothetical protein PKA00_10730 [Saprospiraceae bacterium]|nr:hypothetical protein [Saprospiraceae bacterium]HMQ83376.1 hypothetical protein [Saprospiraceae bacterium]